MSFISWLENIFKKINPQHVAGALAASKQTIDLVFAGKAWLPKFDSDITAAITILDEWKSDSSKTAELAEAINDAVSLVNNDPAISGNDKMIVDVFVGVAESALAFV